MMKYVEGRRKVKLIECDEECEKLLGTHLGGKVSLCPTRYYYNAHDGVVVRCCGARYAYEEHDPLGCRIGHKGHALLLLKGGCAR